MKSAQQICGLHPPVIPTTVIDTQVVHVILTIEFMEDEDTVGSDGQHEGGYDPHDDEHDLGSECAGEKHALVSNGGSTSQG